MPPISLSDSISRRQVIKQALGLSAASTAFDLFTGHQALAAGSQTLTSGYIPIFDCVPLIVAYEKGFFKENGIKADKPVLIRSWPALMEAFTSRQILLTHILLPQVIFMRYAQKIPIRSIAFNHVNVIAMLLSKGTAKISDLGGKAVGIPTWWSPHNAIFQDVLRKAGLKPVVGKEQLAPNEVALRIIPPPDMVEALKSGKIAASSISEPYGAAAEVLADATLVKMSGDVWNNHPCCQSVFLQQTIDKDKPWAQAVINAIYKAHSGHTKTVRS